jgi:hypothetical protein
VAGVRTDAATHSRRAARCGRPRLAAVRPRGTQAAAADGGLCDLASACETAHWPSGTFETAYWRIRANAIADVIDADPVADCVRRMMTESSEWTGSASDLLRSGRDRDGGYHRRADWPKTPRALAGRLRRAQTFLRTLGIEIRFARTGRLGTRVIHIRRPSKSRSGKSPASSADRSEPSVASGWFVPSASSASDTEDLTGQQHGNAAGATPQTVLTVAAEPSSTHRLCRIHFRTEIPAAAANLAERSDGPHLRQCTQSTPH